MRLRHHMGLLLTSLCLTVFVSLCVQAIPYTGLVVLGDSLSDSGNNASVFDNIIAPPGTPPGTLRTPTPIAFSAFIPTLPYASGRYSNGPVWVETFAASLGLSALPSLIGGTNFAFGGARTGPGGSSFPFSLLDQKSQFLGTTGGIAAASNLYVVQGGGNDARDAFQTAALGGDPTPLLSQFVANIKNIVLALTGAGATDLLLVNVPDIGKTPAIRSLGAGASSLASALAASMNAALDATLASLLLPANTHIFELDAFGVVNDLFSHPANFGLTDVTSACGASAACIASPSGTLFWDGIHPTTAAHARIAQFALQAIPEPATPLLIGFGLLVFALFRRRSQLTSI